MPKFFKKCEESETCETYNRTDCLAMECFKHLPQATNQPVPQVCSKDLLSDRKFYIAYAGTDNEQIFDAENRVIIWTRVDRRIEDVTTDLDDGTWRGI